MTVDNKTDANSDPFLEAMAKKKEEPVKVSTTSAGETGEIVLFFIMWLVFAGLITWGCLDYGIHVVFSVLIGIVGGFITSGVAFIFGKSGVYF